MVGRLTHAQIDRIDAAATESGLELLRADSHRPRYLEVRLPGTGTSLSLIVYIWAIRPGGGPSGVRPEDERRVQQTRPGDADFITSPGASTLLLGCDPDADLYAAWDFPLRRWTREPPGHPGGKPIQSPSAQTRQSTLDEAQRTGLAFYAHTADARQQDGTKVAGEELVANFRPDHFGDYLTWLNPQTVPCGSSPVARTVKRRLVATQRLERDARFAKHVTDAYNQRCCFCGFGAGVIEAAHVNPLKDGGPDDVTNGIALCPTHHRLFDKGYILIDPGSLAVTANDARMRAFRVDPSDRHRVATEIAAQPHWPTDVHKRPDAGFVRHHRRLHS